MSNGENGSRANGLDAAPESVSELSGKAGAAGVSLTADCTRCVGLCCAAFAFERSEMFASDKPADTACTHLGRDFSCGIHGERQARGFRGCTIFDCHGAGQRVAQDIFGGSDWRSDPSLAAPMFRAFRAMVKIHDHLRLLEVFNTLPLDDDERRDLARFRRLLEPEGGWDRQSLERFQEGRMIAEFSSFARSLRSSSAAAALRARVTAGP